jgi:hypothetical protein
MRLPRLVCRLAKRLNSKDRLRAWLSRHLCLVLTEVPPNMKRSPAP